MNECHNFLTRDAWQDQLLPSLQTMIWCTDAAARGTLTSHYIHTPQSVWDNSVWLTLLCLTILNTSTNNKNLWIFVKVSTQFSSDLYFKMFESITERGGSIILLYFSFCLFLLQIERWGEKIWKKKDIYFFWWFVYPCFLIFYQLPFSDWFCKVVFWN